MSWPIVAVVVVAVIAAVLGGLRFMGREAAPDVRVLSQLRQAGSDLSKPHPIEFFLYFPSKEARDRIATKLQTRGYAVTPSETAKGANHWSVVATKSMVPEVAQLVHLRTELGALAATERGEYDGWGTPVVK